jgi:hypothetical protein
MNLERPERVLAIISRLESLGEAQMAEEIRALHIECEPLRAQALPHTCQPPRIVR